MLLKSFFLWCWNIKVLFVIVFNLYLNSNKVDIIITKQK